jgi:hypothetical protein
VLGVQVIYGYGYGGVEVIVCVGTTVMIVGEGVTVGVSGVAEDATVAVGRLASWVETAAAIAAGESFVGVDFAWAQPVRRAVNNRIWYKVRLDICGYCTPSTIGYVSTYYILLKNISGPNEDQQYFSRFIQQAQLIIFQLEGCYLSKCSKVICLKFHPFFAVHHRAEYLGE